MFLLLPGVSPATSPAAHRNDGQHQADHHNSQKNQKSSRHREE